MWWPPRSRCRLDKAGALTCRDHRPPQIPDVGLHLMSGYYHSGETVCAVDYRYAHGRTMNSRGSFVHGDPNKRSCKAESVWLGLRWLHPDTEATMTPERRRLTSWHLERARWPLGLDCVPQMEPA